MSEGPFADIGDAAQALTDAYNAPEPSEAEPAQGTSPAAEATPEGAIAPEGTTSNEDSFTNIDPSTLSPELQAVYRSMQGDYTRGKQAIAPYRQLADAGVDPARVQQSLEFVQALETDPGFVAEVHQYLTEQLQSQGYSFEDASAIAQDQVENASDEGSLGGSDPQLVQKLDRIEGWVERQEQQQREMFAANQLQRAEMAIRQADPSLTDTDMERVFELAFAHGGDLNAAYGAYRNWRNDVISSYVSAKDATPASLAPPPVSGHAEQSNDGPVSIQDATKAAKAYMDSVSE